VPESCIFGILLNYSGFFWVLTAVSKHIQLGQFMEFHHLNGCGWRLARWALLVSAMLSAIGLAMVANFPETSVPIVHGLGAWFSFFSGLFYVWLYIIITVIIRPKISPACLTLTRALLALITTFCLTVRKS
jgi:hypothetical protein